MAQSRILQAWNSILSLKCMFTVTVKKDFSFYIIKEYICYAPFQMKEILTNYSITASISGMLCQGACRECRKQML